MIDNAPLRTLTHKGLTVEGYSRAAVQSYWRIPELKIGFDLGGQPWGFMATSTWFISHTHLDHIAALPVYVARRRMMKMDPPDIYLPEVAIEPVGRLLRAVSRLDRGRLPCRLLPARPGDEIELSLVSMSLRSRRPPTQSRASATSSGIAAASLNMSFRGCRATRSATCGSRAST